MAASATAAQVYGNLDVVDYLNINADISVGACPTVDQFWASLEYKEQCLSKEARNRHVKEKFHQGRQVQLRHLPRDVSDEEVRQLMRNNGFQCRQVHIIPGSGIARVSLIDPDPSIWEIWSELQQQSTSSWVVRNYRVSALPTHTQDLLCIARLPIELSDQEFEALVSTYGQTRRAFIMYSEKTGESMGYGFVEYAHKESALHAKSSFDGMEFMDATLVCDWLDPSIITLDGLHSKLLYVDKLPKDYRDMAEFRKQFSQLANPPYCQIALRGGAPQDWGLVEFSNHTQAESTMRQMNNAILHGAKIRVSFYIPGVRAINIYMRLLNETCQNKGKDALLPEPPANTISQQLMNLSKHNPAFVQSLQNIITSQIQNLQQKEAAKHSLQNSQSTVNPNPVTTAGTGYSVVHPTIADPSTKGATSIATSATSVADIQQSTRILNTMAPPPPKDPQVSTFPSVISLPSSVVTKPILPAGINTVTTASNGLTSTINGFRSAPIIHPSTTQMTNLLSSLNQGQSIDPGIISMLAGVAVQPQETQTNTLISLLIHALQSTLDKKNVQPVMQPNPLAALTGLQNEVHQAQLQQHMINLWSMQAFQPPTPAVVHTPTGSKRKYSHILPSPETSPENGYIGQHSQGIGGHYADSYLKRLRKN
ncbi:ribonucleoprotein PTB-binding 1-like [Artemia franciscana]